MENHKLPEHSNLVLSALDKCSLTGVKGLYGGQRWDQLDQEPLSRFRARMNKVLHVPGKLLRCMKSPRTINLSLLTAAKLCASI